MSKQVRLVRHLLIVCLFSLIVTIPALSQQPEYVSGGDTWSQGTDMQTARSWHIVETVNGKIYAIGANRPVGSSVEEYDPATDTWTKKADMPTGRTDFSGCSLNEKIYAIGGWSGFSGMSTIEEYDPASNTWTKKSNMPTRRWGHATCSVNGKVYVIGGARDWPVKKMYETIEVYDPTTDSWTSKSSIPTQRWGLVCSVVNGKIYAIGGSLVDSTGVSTVEEYDPDTDTWTTKSSMPTARWGLASAAVNGKIYVIGGGEPYPATKVYGRVEEYDPATDTWTTKTSMPTGRILLAACSVNGKIYACGGEGTGSRDQYAELYIYDTGYITSTESSSIKPVHFNLHQNYPNPFNQTTHISFDVQNNCDVTLKVYDVLGRQVSTLVNRNMNEGQYTVQFNGTGLFSGIYLYRIEMGNDSETRIMLLRK